MICIQYLSKLVFKNSYWSLSIGYWEINLSNTPMGFWTWVWICAYLFQALTEHCLFHTGPGLGPLFPLVRHCSSECVPKQNLSSALRDLWLLHFKCLGLNSIKIPFIIALIPSSTSGLWNSRYLLQSHIHSCKYFCLIKYPLVTSTLGWNRWNNSNCKTEHKGNLSLFFSSRQ